MARVELEHVDKVYANGVRAVIDCTLGVDDGELLVLVGPSGCGKSTVLRLVAGLEEISAGTIRIGGAVVNDRPPQARNVAMVFQDYALYPQMTVRGNLQFPLRMRKLPRAEIARLVERVAALLDLGPLLDRRPRELSGGQRQRVAMGRALVREPAVSLLDEPLSNLDAKLRVQVRAEIGALQARTGTTMIYVTHDQVEAMTLGHRVAVMDKGRVQQVAPPREIYDAPANAFVAGFMGNPPMNLLPARARAAGDDVAIEMAGAVVPLGATPLAGVVRRAPADVATAGIRPEHLDVAERSTDGRNAAAIDAAVEHVEWLGHETLAYVRVRGGDGAALVARLHGLQTLAAGDAVRLPVDPRHLYLFGADGRALRA